MRKGNSKILLSVVSTIHHELFSQIHVSVGTIGSLVQAALNDGGGTEGRTRSALLLVLDRADIAMFTRVVLAEKERWSAKSSKAGFRDRETGRQTHLGRPPLLALRRAM